MKWFYVTGCDTGFGRILATELPKTPGVGVFAGCYTEKSVEELTAGNVVGLRLDVTNEESVAACAAAIKAKVGDAGLQGVVNNAGILVNPGPVEWTPLSDYRRMFEVNVLGTVSVTKSVLPLIRKAQGRIVNVASIAGKIGLPSQPAYCVSKYGVEAFSDVLRRDMLPWGVTVHVIEPGVYKNTGLYSTYQVGLDKLWDNLPDALKADYGEPFKAFFREMLGTALNDLSNSDPSDVPKAMMDALLSDAPGYRYKVGLDSKYLIPPLAMASEKVQDTLLTLDNPKLRVVNPAAAPKNGKQLAMSRYRKSWTWKIVLALVVVFFIRRRMRR